MDPIESYFTAREKLTIFFGRVSLFRFHSLFQSEGEKLFFLIEGAKYQFSSLSRIALVLKLLLFSPNEKNIFQNSKKEQFFLRVLNDISLY